MEPRSILYRRYVDRSEMEPDPQFAMTDRPGCCICRQFRYQKDEVFFRLSYAHNLFVRHHPQQSL